MNAEAQRKDTGFLSFSFKCWKHGRSARKAIRWIDRVSTSGHLWSCRLFAEVGLQLCDPVLVVYGVRSRIPSRIHYEATDVVQGSSNEEILMLKVMWSGDQITVFNPPNGTGHRSAAATGCICRFVGMVNTRLGAGCIRPEEAIIRHPLGST